MNFEEDDLLPISGLQHFIFCERQCALIHLEQAWDENILTAEGRMMHDRVHEVARESRGDIKTVYGMPLRSLRLGLVGKADVVEFHKKTDTDETADFNWLPFPVEFKRGKPKKDDSDKVQLCAQALCLEEMLKTHIPSGALFFGKTRRRLNVVFDEPLRKQTEKAAKQFHDLVESGITPKAVYEKKCESCSMIDQCIPKAIGKKRSVKNYLTKILGEQ